MDQVVYELSQSSASQDQSIFLQKNWLSILDNNNNSYSSGQVTIDTSQLSNSNRFMNYRESYLSIPLLLTASCSADPLWASAVNSCDYAFGLKNNYASVIHSMSVDLQGSTVVQTTPFLSLVNNFRLVTTLAYQDLLTLGPSIGFFPDSSCSFEQNTSASRSGLGTCNNRNLALIPVVSGVFNAQESYNRGLYERQRCWNYDPDGSSGDAIAGSVAFSAMADLNRCNVMYKSYINRKTSGASGTNIWQASISATIFLRHLHPLYDKLPMCKGLYQKITLNLNQPVVSVAAAIPAIAATATFNITASLVAATGILTVTAIAVAGNFLTVGCSFPSVLATTNFTIISQLSVGVSDLAGRVGTYKVSACGVVAIDIASGTLAISPPALVGSSSTLALATVSVPSGGLSPIMLASSGLGNGSATLVPGTYTISLSVGNQVTASSQVLPAQSSGPLSRSIVLNVPSYVMNPMVEQAYISQSIKSVQYSDFYQYIVQNVAGGGSGNINALITNGISGLQSCLVIPVFNTAGNNAVNPLLSPYDPCGGGTTSPLAHISNFNILVSGQNAIYQNQSYTYQAFLNQLAGQNSINGGQIDGLQSSLISQLDFENSYCYYYVDIGRGLPVEASVPKSVVLVGTNNSVYACDYYVFLQYGAELGLNIISGSRVS
jgi:hypothetical protein